MKFIKIISSIFLFSLMFFFSSCVFEKPSYVLVGNKKTEYVITYNLDGGTVTSQVVNKFTDCNQVVLPSVIKNGYEFLGWYENDNLVVTLTENRNYSLTAKWEEKSYVITFDYNGGIDSNNLTSYTSVGIFGAPYAPPTVTKEGYEFVGWYDENDVCVTEFLFPDKDITLIAKWSKLVIVTLDSNGGICNETSLTGLEGSINNSLPIATHEEYEFLGWYDENDNLVEQILYSSDCTLVAKWGQYKTFYEDIPIGTLITFEEGKKYYIQFPQDIDYNLPIIVGAEDSSTSFQGGLYFQNYRSEDLQVTEKQLLLDGESPVTLQYEYFDEENCIVIYCLNLSDFLVLVGATTLTCDNGYGVIWVEKVERLVPIE